MCRTKPVVLADNPLGKIPGLVTEEGKVLFDSRVICEYLDLRAGTGLFPEDRASRMDPLCWQALGDGMAEMLLLWRTELTRADGAWKAATEGWRTEVRAAMEQLERRSGDGDLGPLSYS